MKPITWLKRDFFWDAWCALRQGGRLLGLRRLPRGRRGYRLKRVSPSPKCLSLFSLN